MRWRMGMADGLAPCAAGSRWAGGQGHHRRTTHRRVVPTWHSGLCVAACCVCEAANCPRARLPAIYAAALMSPPHHASHTGAQESERAPYTGKIACRHPHTRAHTYMPVDRCKPAQYSIRGGRTRSQCVPRPHVYTCAQPRPRTPQSPRAPPTARGPLLRCARARDTPAPVRFSPGCPAPHTPP